MKKKIASFVVLMALSSSRPDHDNFIFLDDIDFFFLDGISFDFFGVF